MTISTRPRRASRSAAAQAAVASLAAALVLAAAPVAQAAPGDNGDVKVHRVGTAFDDQRDEPKVCAFYLDAFDFDVLQDVSYTISQQPPTGTAQVLAGSILLVNGTGHTGPQSLPDGHYKLEWTFVGEEGSAKHKVFDVQCASATPSGSTSTPSSGASSSASATGGALPSGAVGTGGGGSVQESDTPEIVAGSGVLAVVALGLGFAIARRRRASGNAAS